MRMIKVLHILQALNGGAGNIVVNYCNQLKDICDFDFAVNTFSATKKLEQSYLDNGSSFFIFSGYKKGIINHIRQLNSIITNKPYDVVYVHLGFASFLPLLISRKNKIKCRIAHSHTSNIPENLFEKAIRTFRANLTKREATVLCACGINSAIWTWGKRDYQSGTVKIIYNAIKVDDYSFSKEQRELNRNGLNLKMGDFACVCVARLTDVKNHMFLIELWKRIMKNKKNYKLFFIGDGELAHLLKKCVIDNGLTDNVIFLGVKYNVNYLLSAFDVFLLPSKYEGVPLSLVEAQSNGLPIIASTNVPPEVKITDLIDFLPLDYGKWIECLISKANRPQMNRYFYAKTVKEQGFDIYSEAQKIRTMIEQGYVNE